LRARSYLKLGEDVNSKDAIFSWSWDLREGNESIPSFVERN
jgi:hypothetical protein